MERTLAVFADAADLARAASERVLDIARSAEAERGVFHIALAGGSTPRALYTRLAQMGVDGAIGFRRWQIWFGDERCVPADHADSNYRMARESWFVPASVKSSQIHRIEAELADTNEAAARYERWLKAVLAPKVGEAPRLDLVLLGMGADGHTASLFPGTSALVERERWVVANRVEKLGAQRITLTYPLLDAARNVLFLVAGADKAETLQRVLEGPPDAANLPSQAVQPTQGTLTWLVDRAAAARLTRSPA